MTEGERIEACNDLLIRLAVITENCHGKAIFHSFMPSFKGTRVMFLDALPPVPQSYLVGQLCADVFVQDNGDIHVMFLEDASTFPKQEELLGTGYTKDINETDAAFVDEIAQDIFQWLEHKKKPTLSQPLH